MTSKPVVVAVLSCALLAAFSGSTSSAASGTSIVDSPSVAGSWTPGAPVSLDRGAIVIDPLADPLPVVSQSVAARILAGARVGAGPQTAVAAHVRVDVWPPSAVSVTYGGLQRLDLPRAWAYVVPEAHESSAPCLVATSGGHLGPSPTASPTPVPSDASGDDVVIVDAATGRGYVYSGAGTGPCSPAPAPSLRALDLWLSVPYVVKQFTPRSAQVVISLPPCAREASFIPAFQSGAVHQGMAAARLPTAPCAGSRSTTVQNVSGRYTSGPHAPTGLLCGAAYDQRLGKPADCVPSG